MGWSESPVGFEMYWDVAFGENPSEFLRCSSNIRFLPSVVLLVLFSGVFWRFPRWLDKSSQCCWRRYWLMKCFILFFYICCSTFIIVQRQIQARTRDIHTPSTYRNIKVNVFRDTVNYDVFQLFLLGRSWTSSLMDPWPEMKLQTGALASKGQVQEKALIFGSLL